MTWSARVAIFTIALVVGYQIYVCGRLAFRPQRPVGARYLFVAWSCLAVAASWDLLVWIGAGDALGGIRTACLGLGLFAIAQALLLGREHILSLKQSETLNEELRRQIAEKSAQLFEALRTLAASAGAAPALEPGQVVQDRYRVTRSLGTGGMGAVYEVVRLADDRRFALKVTRQRDAVALARLAREAQIAAQVTHENVVAIVDVDVATAGFLYMVIELVDGKALHERQERYRELDWTMPVLAQVASGLAALHAHGIVHRDLKPANILIADGPHGEPIVKITDFGISRIADGPAVADEHVTALLKPPTDKRAATNSERTAVESRRAHDSRRRAVERGHTPSSPLTTTGFVAGTPMYMAPEVTTDGAEIKASADVFSFGILAFQVLAGHAPWAEPPSVTSAARRTVPAPRSLVDEVPAVPRAVADLIARCLAMEPTARPTAEELAAAFAKLSERDARRAPA